MAKKLEKSIPWLAVLTICILVVFGAGIVLNEIVADDITPSVTVGNAAPTVGAVVLNNNTVITINENSTKTVVGTTTITDSNTYHDIFSVTSTLYLTNTTTCGVSDANWCYFTDWTTCATTVCSGDSCIASCTVDVWFIAEPSDESSTYPGDAWKMEITAVDSAANSDSESTTQELETAIYMDASTTIGYGTVNPGATSSEAKINATNTGNWDIDIELDGEDMDSSATSIDVGQQKYSTDSSMGNWVGTPLTESPVTLNVVMPKPTATTSDSVDDIFWMIQIPDLQDPGTYSGTNTAGVVWAATTS